MSVWVCTILQLEELKESLEMVEQKDYNVSTKCKDISSFF